MASSQELFEQIKEQYEAFVKNHNDRDNKSAQQRARKAIGNVKNLVVDYRKASVAENK